MKTTLSIVDNRSEYYGGLTFASAKATNTRLMGVVGLVAHFTDVMDREVVQVFHLDYESYGIDGFYEGSDYNYHLLMMTGGLGGELVDISKREMFYLVKKAYDIGWEYAPEFEEYIDDLDRIENKLSDDEEKKLIASLTPEMVSDTHVIQYYLMRSIGCDYQSLINLTSRELFENPFAFVKVPMTLLKSTLAYHGSEGSKRVYQGTSIIDSDDGYELLITQIIIERQKVVEVQVKKRMTLSTIEASFNLKRPEYMKVYECNDDSVEGMFGGAHFTLMMHQHKKGSLYTRFKTNNDHVKEEVYYLNEDVEALYFFSEHEIIIAAFDDMRLQKAGKEFEDLVGDKVEYVVDLKAEDPVLYSYVASEANDVFEYLNQRGK